MRHQYQLQEARTVGACGGGLSAEKMIPDFEFTAVTTVAAIATRDETTSDRTRRGSVSVGRSTWRAVDEDDVVPTPVSIERRENRERERGLEKED